MTDSRENDHGVFIDAEEIVLAEMKRYRAAAELAYHGGAWYVGQHFDAPNEGTGFCPSRTFSAPHYSRFNAIELVRIEALNWFSSKEYLKPEAHKFVAALNAFKFTPAA
jgi:hypothetical protein